MLPSEQERRALRDSFAELDRANQRSQARRKRALDAWKKRYQVNEHSPTPALPGAAERLGRLTRALNRRAPIKDAPAAVARWLEGQLAELKGQAIYRGADPTKIDSSKEDFRWGEWCNPTDLGNLYVDARGRVKAYTDQAPSLMKCLPRLSKIAKDDGPGKNQAIIERLEDLLAWLATVDQPDKTAPESRPETTAETDCTAEPPDPSAESKAPAETTETEVKTAPGALPAITKPTATKPACEAPNLRAPGKRKRDEGKENQCVGVYMAYVNRHETPPGPSEIAAKVGCHPGTASRAIKRWEDKRQEMAREDARDRYRSHG